MSKSGLIILMAAAVALASPARADLAAAVVALDNRDYAAARQQLQALAAGGDAQAALHLARMYEEGLGVPASLALAAGWYRKAGEAGAAEAQLRYGEWLEQGTGVPRNRKEALDWFLRAAKKGNVPAKTKVGKYALYGIAKKPNFVEARKWLNEAAEAGDAEAQALIRSLAAQNHPILTVPGTSRPTEAAAQRVLAEINDLIAPLLHAGTGAAPMRLGLAPTISAGTDGHVVTLPMVELVGASATLHLGNVQVAFAPDGEDYAVQVRLPARARLTGAAGDLATVAIARHSITGRWSTTLHTLTDYQAEIERLAVQPQALPFAVAVGRISAGRSFAPAQDGRHDVSERIELTDVRVDTGTGAERRVVRAAGLAYAAEYEGFDLAALGRVAEAMGVDWRTGAMLGGGGEATAPQVLPSLLKDMTLSARVKDVVVEGADGARLGGLAGGEMSLAGANLDQALSALNLSYAHDGLDGAAGLPRRANAVASLSRLPLPRLLAAGLSALRSEGGAPAVVRTGLPVLDQLTLAGVPELGRALREARSELRINELALAGDAYEIAASGVFQPAGQGMAGALDVSVSGFEQLGEAGTDMAGLDLAPWRRLALRQQDKAGRPVDVFRVAFLASGKVTVNGSDATALVGTR